MQLGKYNSNRDELIHALCLADWANEHFGDVSTYGLYVWRIEFNTQDVAMNNGEFNSLLDSLGLAANESLRNELVGVFNVIEDSQGLVTVVGFNDWYEAQQVFDAMKEEYERFEALEAEADGMDMTEWEVGGYERDYPNTD